MACYKGYLKFDARNLTRGTSLGSRIDLAETSAARQIGLLKHNCLETGCGLWIVPCESIHMFFMKFPIDVVYVDRKHRVRKLVENLRPWRVSACLSAHSVVELPVGAIRESATEKGDQLEFVEV